ncbi:hypothetical protein WR164_15350 [Philodulcilactobacillus myokoensis]|uniref:Uncharacterized protein n=1 Tax=Philodulcilactobacillus myokoensis TaxID=2929573 RepID=A0A9W6ESZ1_9LACO|nr:hypothetical protein WR164_15350 [Philodulcilactobacillus myokoensis]
MGFLYAFNFILFFAGVIGTVVTFINLVYRLVKHEHNYTRRILLLIFFIIITIISINIDGSFIHFLLHP